jgi:ABC-2 type transport system permease protein
LSEGPATTASGNIYDLGYRGYDGPRLGRSSVARTLVGITVRGAYGIGRGGRSKIIPFGLAIFALLPALLAVGVAAIIAQAGPGAEAVEDASPISHASYHGLVSVLVMLFCAAQAPELFGRDQRYGVLPLFFSRSLGRLDYALARMAGLFLALFLMCLAPHVVLTLGAMLAAADPLAGLRDELDEIPRYLAICVLEAGLLGGVAAVVAAWTPRRAYATATIIAIFIISPLIVLIVAELAVSDLARVLVLFSPGDLLDGANAAIFGSIPDSPAVAAAGLPAWAFLVAALIGVVGCVALVLRRYASLTV